MLLIKCEIANWRKFQKRFDVKKISWFAFDNCLFNDPVIYELPPAIKLVYVGAMSVCSRQCHFEPERLVLSVKQMSDELGLSSDEIIGALQVLNNVEIKFCRWCWIRRVGMH